MMRLSDERSIPSRRIKKHSRTLGLIVAAWIIGFLIFMVRLILFGEGITWQVTLIFAPLCSVR
jgi:steroid 5-alpha reductase family enzyme